MPRSPSEKATKLIAHGVGSDAIRNALYPLLNYTRCESSAFLRKAITHAIHKDLASVSPCVELVPGASTVLLGEASRRSKDKILAIDSEQNINQAAVEASAQLKKARSFFEQANSAGEETKPIMYYYGGAYFLDFICHSLVRREPRGNPSHGLSFTADSKGWDFDKDWARNKCRIQIESTGDFPFYIDALTISGWPSLFSAFRLHQNVKSDPKIDKVNPVPLFQDQRPSLDLLCNFDLEIYLRDHPEVDEWLVGTPKDMVWRVSSLLLDLMVVYVAASLARYYTPAWKYIIEAERSAIYNDVREAYRGVSDGLALFFEDEHPFQYSFGTRIPPY
jgi:hypothetical protein